MGGDGSRVREGFGSDLVIVLDSSVSAGTGDGDRERAKRFVRDGNLRLALIFSKLNLDPAEGSAGGCFSGSIFETDAGAAHRVMMEADSFKSVSPTL